MSATLLSSDNGSFSAVPSILEISGLLGCLNLEEPVHLSQVDSETLGKILAFCEHYSTDTLPEIAKPIQSEDFSTLVPAWYFEFLNVEHALLFKLAEAANYMDIPPLLNLVAAKIASMIQNKSVERIRELFHLPNTLTPEEEEAMQEEYRWCMED